MKCPGLDVANFYFIFRKQNGQKIHRNHKILMLFKHFLLKNSTKLPPTELAETTCIYFFSGGEILQLGDFFFRKWKKKKKNHKKHF
jgi:hypothetical protein